MGSLSARETVELDASVTIEAFEASLKKIADEILKNEEYASVIKAGPVLVGVTKVTAKTTVAIISFNTVPAKREKARSIIWEALKKARISLA
jgi:small-conductance mechanosensitive channel